MPEVGQADAFDVLIIGGGINGAGIARDAAGRGLRVLLCEQRDLGGATSSASTKLIHGGLRYLEYHEFKLVREALREREVLLRLAPHIVWPLRFVLPHDAGQRPVNRAVGRYAIAHHVLEFWCPDQLGCGLFRLIHVFGECAQLFEMAIDLCVRAFQRILRLEATVDRPQVVLVDEVVDERVAQCARMHP